MITIEMSCHFTFVWFCHRISQSLKTNMFKPNWMFFSIKLHVIPKFFLGTFCVGRHSAQFLVTNLKVLPVSKNAIFFIATVLICLPFTHSLKKHFNDKTQLTLELHVNFVNTSNHFVKHLCHRLLFCFLFICSS